MKTLMFVNLVTLNGATATRAERLDPSALRQPAVGICVSTPVFVSREKVVTVLTASGNASVPVT